MLGLVAQWILRAAGFVADMPFGLARVWRIYAEKPLSRRGAFDVNMLQILLVAYVVQLLAVSFAGGPTAEVSRESMAIIFVAGLISLFLVTIQETGE